MTAPTFRKYMVFLRAMLDKVEDRLHAQKATSNSASTSGAVAAANWDDAVPTGMRAVPSAASSNSAQGLGFMDNDFLSAWSTPVTSPSSTAASSTAPPSVAGQGSSAGAGAGLRPPAPKAAPLSGLNAASGLGLLDMQMGGPACNNGGATGVGGLGGAPMRSTAASAPQNRQLSPGQPHSAGMGAPLGMSRGSGLGGSPHMHAPPPMPATAAAADPFADLLGGPVSGKSSPAQKPDQQQGTWDPFA